MKWNTLRQLLTHRRDSQPADPTRDTRVVDTGTPSTRAETEPGAAERYRLEKRLGGGAMGEVWRATDTLLDRPVAIKYLKATQDARFKELFLSEARILAQANHPNITLIYDAVFDEQRNGFYLVMEYVQGTPLSVFLAEHNNALALGVILEVAIGVLRALQYAHGKDIVHRDIKPANVILQEDGVKLTDFGVAGLVSLLAQGTQQIVGTPSYMSPEQIEGKAMDGRADLYSLGIMLFQMASGGHLPFPDTDTMALFEAHLQQQPLPLGQFTAEVPLALEHAIMRLLAKAPADRYPSAEVTLAVMEAIQARRRLSQPHLNLLDLAGDPLVGRVAELEQIEAIWTDVQSTARPHLLVVKGEKGIGKSRLVTEFLGRSVIDQGAVALAGAGEETGRPYAPLAAPIATLIDKGLVRQAATRERVNLLLAHIPDLARLLNLTPLVENQPEAAPETPAGAGLWQNPGQKMEPAVSPQAQQQLYAAVLALLAELGPTAVLLERANFLDPATLALVTFLIHQPQLPLLVIAAWQETGTAIPWLDPFSATEKTVLTLPPLTTPAVVEYLPHLTGGPVSEVVVDSIMERSRGNPQRVAEITRQLIEAREIQPDENGLWRYVAREMAAPEDAFLPKAVLTAFTRRLARLDERSREALILAAVSEPETEFDFELWVILLGGEAQRDIARQALDEAVRERLVRPAGGQRYAFRVADVDRLLTATLPETQRRDLHRRIADTLRQHRADPALIQYHEEQAA